MGVKTWIVVRAPRHPRELMAALPALDEAATIAMVATLFPDRRFDPPEGADLSYTAPSDGSVIAGCYGGLEIVISTDVAVDQPSTLPSKFVAPQGVTVLHASHSVVDWFAYAIWEDGQLRRSLSVSPDSGVMEDIGQRADFEQPYWQGQQPAVDPDEALEEGEEPYPLPFHPLELSDIALRALFGFQLEGYVDQNLYQPEQLRMLRFSPAGTAEPASVAPGKPWWKFWA